METGIVSDPRVELDEARKLLAMCAVVAVESNMDVARKLDERETEQLRQSVRTVTLTEAQKRLTALTVQNPGVVFEAMRRCDYNIRLDGDGNVMIIPDDHDGIGGAAGKGVDYDEFVKAANEGKFSV